MLSVGIFTISLRDLQQSSQTAVTWKFKIAAPKNTTTVPYPHRAKTGKHQFYEIALHTSEPREAGKEGKKM